MSVGLYDNEAVLVLITEILSMSEEKQVRERLDRLVKAMREIAIEAVDCADELQAIMDAQPSRGQEAKKLLDHFVKYWERKHAGRKMVVNGAKDMASLKRVLRTLSAPDIAARIAAYFRCVDKFVVDADWSLPVFISRINSLSEHDGVVAASVVGCTHTPRCATEVQHTRRSMDEMKR